MLCLIVERSLNLKRKNPGVSVTLGASRIATWYAVFSLEAIFLTEDALQRRDLFLAACTFCLPVPPTYKLRQTN